MRTLTAGGVSCSIPGGRPKAAAITTREDRSGTDEGGPLGGGEEGGCDAQAQPAARELADRGQEGSVDAAGQDRGRGGERREGRRKGCGERCVARGQGSGHGGEGSRQVGRVTRGRGEDLGQEEALRPRAEGGSPRSGWSAGVASKP